MINLKGKTISGRFFLFMFLILTILMGGVFIIVEKNNRRVILMEGRKRGISSARYLATLSTPAILMYDFVKLEQNVDEVAKEQDIVYAMILGKDGSVLAHSSRDELIGKRLVDPLSRAALASPTYFIQDYYDEELGIEIWDIAYPVYIRQDTRWGTVRIGFSKESLKRELALNRNSLIILYLVVLLLAGVTARIMANRITGPIRELSKGALAVSRGNLALDISVHTGDEVEELAQAFNSMTGDLAKNRERQAKLIKELSKKNEQLRKEISTRERLEGELIKTERLRALGEMSGGVAHDFNNILGAILGRAQLLLEKIRDSGTRKGIEIIEKAAMDGAETVRRIQEFTRMHADASTLSPVDVNEVIQDALEFTKSRWKHESEAMGINIEVKQDMAIIPPTIGDPSGLREVFTNLIINAIDAMPGGGTITIRTLCKNETIIITLTDTGLGMSESVQKRIFEPFFTTKGTRGSGLGLSICYGIISRHDGVILIESKPRRGTIFTIRLPVRLPEGEKVSGKKRDDTSLQADILVIDDDEMMRVLLSDVLRTSGCEVSAVGSGREGIEIFQERRFDLVFTDLGMEDLSGWKVAEEIKRLSPGTPVALISGWGKQLDPKNARERGVDYIISKPFKLDDLRNLISKAMAVPRD